MSTPDTSHAPHTPHDLAARLDALHRQGAARVAPARWRQLQALADRLPSQPGPVQAVLQARLQTVLLGLEQRVAAAAGHTTEPSATAAAVQPPTWPDTPRIPRELAGAARFRRVWSHARAQDSVAQATAQRPANAGPLNSQVLALQSLQRMPPAYLRRFLAHMEALQWLQAVAPQVAPAPRKRRGAPAAGKAAGKTAPRSAAGKRR